MGGEHSTYCAWRPLEGELPRLSLPRLRGWRSDLEGHPFRPYRAPSHAGRDPRLVGICPRIWANAIRILRQRLSIFGRMQNSSLKGWARNAVTLSHGEGMKAEHFPITARGAPPEPKASKKYCEARFFGKGATCVSGDGFAFPQSCANCAVSRRGTLREP